MIVYLTNMNQAFSILILFLLTSCSSKTYVLEKTSSIPIADYTHSFAIVSMSDANETEQKLERLARKHLIKAKWRYDDQNPDFLLTLSYKSGYVHMNLLDAQTYACKWQGKVSSLGNPKDNMQLDRAMWAALR